LEETIDPPQTIEEKDAVVTEAEDLTGESIDDPEVKEAANEVAKE
jgi:hypothetical protein